jgi:hypothetical protein
MDSKIEDLIFILILKYLTPNELLVVQECSWRWNFCANSSILWSHHHDELWKTIDDSPQPTLLDKIVDEIPLGMIVENLDSNVYYDQSKIRCDLDYFRLCQARLLFRHSKSCEKLLLPFWSCNINLYKASYYFSKYESHRSSLLLSELVAPYKWKCFFKHSLEVENGWDCVFREDGTLFSSLHEKPMTWRVSQSVSPNIQIMFH